MALFQKGGLQPPSERGSSVARGGTASGDPDRQEEGVAWEAGPCPSRAPSRRVDPLGRLRRRLETQPPLRLSQEEREGERSHGRMCQPSFGSSCIPVRRNRERVFTRTGARRRRAFSRRSAAARGLRALASLPQLSRLSPSSGVGLCLLCHPSWSSVPPADCPAHVATPAKRPAPP